MLTQVMPGFQRARQNWRRSANLATMLSLPPRPDQLAQLARPDQLALHPAPPPTFLPAPVHGGVRPRGEVLPSAEGAAFALATSEATMLTPMGRSRQRSRSMTSPSALLEEYKQRWTCKVFIIIFTLLHSRSLSFQVCLTSEVTILIQPCGHLCLCEPCSLAIRRHFLEERLRDFMFGSPMMGTISLTPCPMCPMCRGPIQSSVKVFV